MISYSDDFDIATLPPAVSVVLRCRHLGAVPLVNGMVLLHAPSSLVAHQAPRRACLKCVWTENHFLYKLGNPWDFWKYLEIYWAVVLAKSTLKGR